jgi:hypothetical protein
MTGSRVTVVPHTATAIVTTSSATSTWILLLVDRARSVVVTSSLAVAESYSGRKKTQISAEMCEPVAKATET